MGVVQREHVAGVREIRIENIGLKSEGRNYILILGWVEG
jgi:hypothetical protein